MEAIARAGVLAFLSLISVPDAQALDRSGAIEVARRQVKSECAAATFCTFDASVESNKWHVRVEVTNDNPAPRHRKVSIFVIDQGGRIVGRIEGR
jgi:hypothetical protein